MVFAAVVIGLVVIVSSLIYIIKSQNVKPQPKSGKRKK